MKLVTRAFAHWCHAHDIPLNKVTLVVRANDDLVRDRIERALVTDLGAEMRYVSERLALPLHHATINGVRVSFSTLDRSTT